MNIVVCVKQVPDTTAKKTLLPDFRLDRTSVDNVINPFDEYALEEALRLKEAHGGEVTVLTMGPVGAEDSIRKALAMGADRGILVEDPGLEGSDWAATCTVLATVLRRAPFDLVLTGTESTDARSGLVPGGLAELLGLPLLTYVVKLELFEDTVRVDRQVSGGFQAAAAQVPCVLSIVKGANDPRYPSLKGVMAAKRKEVEKLNLAHLGLSPDEVGTRGSRTVVTAAEARPEKSGGRVVQPDSADEAAQAIADFLQAKKFI